MKFYSNVFRVYFWLLGVLLPWVPLLWVLLEWVPLPLLSTVPPKEVELRVEPPGMVQEGLGFTLSCSCQALPSSNYSWYLVSGGAPGVRVPLPDHGANLTVERAERRHTGRYYCLAVNNLGEKESDPVHLDVLCRFPPDPNLIYFTIVACSNVVFTLCVYVVICFNLVCS